MCYASIQRRSDVGGRVRDDSIESGNETTVRGWRPSRHWNPGADRWTWTNGTIGDTTRKAVKAKVSRLNDSRYTCKYSGRHRIVTVDRARCTDVRTLLRSTRIQRHMRIQYRGAGTRMYAPRKEKYFCFLPGSYVTNLHYKNALTIRSEIFASQTNSVEISSIFLHLFARRLADLFYAKWLGNLCRELNFLFNFPSTKKNFMKKKLLIHYLRRLLLKANSAKYAANILVFHNLKLTLLDDS